MVETPFPSQNPVSTLIACDDFCHAGKNFLRAGQMNTNVATWARLLKRAAPTNCTTNNTALSPNSSSQPTQSSG